MLITVGFRRFTPKWAHVVAPTIKNRQAIVDERGATGPAPVHSSLDAFATILSPDALLSHSAKRTNVCAHIIQKSDYNTGPATGVTVKIDVGGDSVQLRKGVGVYITLIPGSKVDVENVGEKESELLLFDTD